MTLVAPGLGASVAQTRPLLSGVPGTKVFHEARGHGRSWSGTPGYQQVADDLLADADREGATQALGVSLGAGALLRLVAQHPTRFARLVLHLPAALDTPHPGAVRRAGALAEALATREAARVEAFVRAELPADLSGASLEAYVRARTRMLLASDLGPLLEALATDVPVPDLAALRQVDADVLVTGEEGDPTHPASVARAVAVAVPHARVVLFARPASMFRERSRLLGLVREHLAGPSGRTTDGRLGDAVS